MLRNPARFLPELGERDELRRRYGLDGPTLVFAGRLVAAEVARDRARGVARRRVSPCSIAGDGPERDRLERLGRRSSASWSGPLPRRAAARSIFELLRAADASLLSSAWENFPHLVVEALAVGTPVIATERGGVARGGRGRRERPDRRAAATRGARGRDRALLRRAPSSRQRLRRGRPLRRSRATCRGRCTGAWSSVLVGGRGPAVKPRVLFVGRTRYRLPLGASLGAKWDALRRQARRRVLASGEGRHRPAREVRARAAVPIRAVDGPRF